MAQSDDITPVDTSNRAKSVTPTKPHKLSFVPVQNQPSKRKLIIQSIAIFVLASTLGFAVSAQSIGEIAIGIYAIIAFALRFSSRTSFGLALLGFGMIMTFEIIEPESDIIANFAVYAFLLLTVGTFSLALEIHQQAKWDKERRQQDR
jgi:hypothetical protein